MAGPHHPQQRPVGRADQPRRRANGIGEKLQQTLGTEQRFPDRLQKLLEAMRDREAGDAPKSQGSLADAIRDAAPARQVPQSGCLARPKR